MSEEKKIIPDWKLERFLLGELPVHEKNEIRQALEKDSLLKARLDNLRRENVDILAKCQQEDFVRRMEAKMAARNSIANGHLKGHAKGNVREFRPVKKQIFAFAAAAVLLFLFLPASMTTSLVPDAPVDDSGVEVVRIKGAEAEMFLYQKVDSGSNRLQPGDTVQVGDRIQIRYRAAEARYGFIFSLDGNGLVTRHMPLQGKMAALLDTSGTVNLDFSYELDDAPRWEKFYFISSAEAFSLDGLITSLQDSFVSGKDTLDLPENLNQQVFVLNKAKR